MSSPAALSRLRRLSEDPLKRTLIACDRCKGRKTKCLGVAPYPCMTCNRAGAECVYLNVKKIYVSEEEYKQLRERAQAASPAGTATSEGIFSPPATDQTGDADDEPWHKHGLVIIVTKTGKCHYLGPASSDAILTELDPESRGSVASNVFPLHHAALPLRRERSPALPKLPPLATARRWYAAQFAYIGSIFAFIQPKYFESRLTRVYNQPPDTSSQEDCLLACQILLILAFGKMYSLNAYADDDGPPGFGYFQAAMKLLPDIHEEGSVLFVEVLGLVAYFMQILNRRDAAFLYVGLAVRMAVSLGLHQEVTNSDMDDTELEHRRRVWASTYSMDRILCVKSGNPISIHDDDIDVAWPSPLASLDLDPAQPRILAHYSLLSRILGRIGEDIYRKQHKSGTTLLTSVQGVMKDLENWRREMPPELMLDFQGLDQKISREAVSTFLHYYQCVNMAGRPLLFRVCQRRLESLASGTATANWQEGLSTNAVHIVRKSIAGAVQATLVMEAASKHNLLATYGFMDGEHAFSAALVLVMVNVAFPYNDRDARSMELALSILSGMAEKGNEYIRGRHELLLNLWWAMSRQAGNVVPEDVTFPQTINTINTTNDAAGDNSQSAADTSRPDALQYQDLPFHLDTDESMDTLFDDPTGNGSIGFSGDWMNAFPYGQVGSRDFG